MLHVRTRTALLFVILWTAAGAARAQLPPAPTPQPVRPFATITYGGTASLTPPLEQGLFDLIAVQPSETLQVVLGLPLSVGGATVPVSARDGGTLNLPASGGLVGSDGNLSFSFQAGGAAGLYRVVCWTAAGEYTLCFWVVNPSHPLPANSTMLRAY